MAAFCRPTACPPRRSSRLNKWSRAAPPSKSARSAAGPSDCARSSAARTTPRTPGSILQEKCDGGDTEITAEVFNAQGKLRVFCRERVVTKSGVCTKMRPLHIPEIEDYICTLTGLLPCPATFCAQFMQHTAGGGISSTATCASARARRWHPPPGSSWCGRSGRTSAASLCPTNGCRLTPRSRLCCGSTRKWWYGDALL